MTGCVYRAGSRHHRARIDALEAWRAVTLSEHAETFLAATLWLLVLVGAWSVVALLVPG